MRRDYLEEQLEQTRPPEPAKPQEEPADALHELQSGAGNRAMTALLQRDALSMRDPPPVGLGGAPPLAGGIDLAYIERHQREVKQKIRAYLDGDREKIACRNAERECYREY